MKYFFYLINECLKDTLKRIELQYLPFPMKVEDDEVHLARTMEWLMRAYENGNGGVASHHSLLSGRWLNPFPETTGYIIPTFFDYADYTKNYTYSEIAISLADWLCGVQHESGACMQGAYDKSKGKNKPIIFNTGQNIFGFLRTYGETRQEKYLIHAKKAGDFLTESVDARGIWNRHLHHGLPHTYNSRTSWALLELHQIIPEERYKTIALANLEWVLQQQTENGWFRNANFKPQELPNTHGLAYTLRGLLESYEMTRDDRCLEAAKRTADGFLQIFMERKFLYTFWDENWQNHGKYFKWGKGRYICLTGNIQLSLVWMRLYEITQKQVYLEAAFRMLDLIKSLQSRSVNGCIDGGIKGAFPVYGSYSALKYPNWAAKFFADALMLKIKLTKGVETKHETSVRIVAEQEPALS